MTCNTLDVTFPICTPTLVVSSVKLFYFLRFGFLSSCVVVIVMHLISCHHVHCICIRVRLMHPSIFPVVRFAFRRFILLRWSFLALFRVWGLNISGLDRDLPSGLGLLPVDRLSSFLSFGLRLLLQHTRGLFGPSVNRWSIKRSPNDTKLDRRSTGSKPRPLGKSWSNPEMFNPHTQKKARNGHWRRTKRRNAKRTTGKKLECRR